MRRPIDGSAVARRIRRAWLSCRSGGLQYLDLVVELVELPGELISATAERPSPREMTLTEQ